MIKKLKSLKNKAGFTLIEMIVVTAIFGVITAVLVFNYGDFTDRTLVTNMAYEIALTVRQAQVFGLGVRGAGNTFSDSFDNAYGVFVSLPAGEDNTNSLILFLDANTDTECDGSGGSACACTGDAGDECVEKLTLQRGIAVTSLRVDPGAGCELIEELSVSFKRPNPDALIRQNGATVVYKTAEIEITAPRSKEVRYVIIRDTGQISVSRDPYCGS